MSTDLAIYRRCRTVHTNSMKGIFNNIDESVESYSRSPENKFDKLLSYRDILLEKWDKVRQLNENIILIDDENELNEQLEQLETNFNIILKQR